MWYTMNTYPICDSLLSRSARNLVPRVLSYPPYGARGAASLPCRNRAEITVVMCERKPYPVWFSYRYKSYPV